MPTRCCSIGWSARRPSAFSAAFACSVDTLARSPELRPSSFCGLAWSICVSDLQVDAIVPVLALRVFQVCDDSLDGFQNVLKAAAPRGVAVLAVRTGLVISVTTGHSHEERRGPFIC